MFKNHTFKKIFIADILRKMVHYHKCIIMESELLNSLFKRRPLV